MLGGCSLFGYERSHVVYDTWHVLYFIYMNTTLLIYDQKLPCPSLLRNRKALPDGLPKPPHGLPHVPRRRRRVRSPEEQRARLCPVVAGAEPRPPGYEDALCDARGENLVFYFEDAGCETGVLFMV